MIYLIVIDQGHDGGGSLEQYDTVKDAFESGKKSAAGRDDVVYYVIQGDMLVTNDEEAPT